MRRYKLSNAATSVVLIQTGGEVDWSEAVRKAAIIAEATGHITLEQFSELIPPAAEPEDIETLIFALDVTGIVFDDE